MVLLAEIDEGQGVLKRVDGGCKTLVKVRRPSLRAEEMVRLFIRGGHRSRKIPVPEDPPADGGQNRKHHESPPGIKAIADGPPQHPAPDPRVPTSVLHLSSPAFHLEQHSARAAIVACLSQHLSQLAIRFWRERFLTLEPPEARFGIARAVSRNVSVNKAIQEKLSVAWPAPLVVDEGAR
jgi:hypothetical protein